MNLYACIISGAENKKLVSVAQDFSAKIEMLEDGVLFDLSGLKNLMGNQEEIAKRISDTLQKKHVEGNLAVSKNPDTAVLFAKHVKGITTDTEKKIGLLPTQYLELEADIQGVFDDLGLENIEQLKEIPTNDFISRYGQDFRHVIDLINQEGKRTITPNIKEQNVEWRFELEHSVKGLERLVFILSNGISEVLNETQHRSLSTEHITVEFGFRNKETKTYEVKVSFPTIQKIFWRKIIDHRISQDLPESSIKSIKLICHFTKPRSAQFGLYSATNPEPEGLHLTINKIKNLVGEEAVGVPVLLDSRLERPFKLDSGLEPKSIENAETKSIKPQITFSYYEPPIPAFVWIEYRKLIYLKTNYFEGKVKKHGGIWRANSHWWAGFWSTEEWDVEVENQGVFRISRKGREWFVTGEYD